MSWFNSQQKGDLGGIVKKKCNRYLGQLLKMHDCMWSVAEIATCISYSRSFKLLKPSQREKVTVHRQSKTVSVHEAEK